MKLARSKTHEQGLEASQPLGVHSKQLKLKHQADFQAHSKQTAMKNVFLNRTSSGYDSETISGNQGYCFQPEVINSSNSDPSIWFNDLVLRQSGLHQYANLYFKVLSPIAPSLGLLTNICVCYQRAHSKIPPPRKVDLTRLLKVSIACFKPTKALGCNFCWFSCVANKLYCQTPFKVSSSFIKGISLKKYISVYGVRGNSNDAKESYSLVQRHWRSQVT